MAAEAPEAMPDIVFEEDDLGAHAGDGSVNAEETYCAPWGAPGGNECEHASCHVSELLWETDLMFRRGASCSPVRGRCVSAVRFHSFTHDPHDCETRTFIIFDFRHGAHATRLER